ncbi:MAG TPA: DNA-directed RNA polymerase subunit D [Euryarchaeota archaeon]|nr:DNA-directed RNA polymerase subunit D [Euryarchaeota archaeon]
MDVEFLELTETSARLVIKGLTPAQVNALRRTMISDVPKMAIHFVDFYHGPSKEGKESTSAFFDEIVSHRLGLVPIPTDLSLFSRVDECSCDGEGCPNCSITYSLNKSGPAVVYSGDLEPAGHGGYKVKDSLIPLTKLKEDQSITVVAKAILGSGKEHAKWQAVIAAGYKFKSVLEVNGSLCNQCEDCIKACPRNIMAMSGKTPLITHLEECTACRSCADACTKKALKILLDPSEVIFKFETDGALHPKDVLEKALDLLEGGFKDIEEQVDTL